MTSRWDGSERRAIPRGGSVEEEVTQFLLDCLTNVERRHAERPNPMSDGTCEEFLADVAKRDAA